MRELSISADLDWRPWILRSLAGSLLLVGASPFAVKYVEYVGPPKPIYFTTPVETGTITSVVKATGSITPNLTVDVSSQLSGQVAEVLVNYNDKVRAGQPIARIASDTYVTRIKEARAALKIAEASVQLQQASRDRASWALANTQTAQTAAAMQFEGLRIKFAQRERDVERAVALARSASVSNVEVSRARTQRDADAAELRAAEQQLSARAQDIHLAATDVRMADANLRTAEAAVEQKQAALEEAILNLQRTTIVSPIDGTIIKRDVNPGQVVAVEFDAKTMFKIASDLAEMDVYGRIDEADIGRLKVGQPVRFTVDAYPEQIFEGRVTQIRQSPEVSQNVVTYSVVIAAANKDELLFPGMTASLRITVGETEPSSKIPNQALNFRPPQAMIQDGAVGNASVVWVLDGGGRPVPIPIKTGARDDTGTQVLTKNLAEGQRVIVGMTHPPAAKSILGFRLRQ